MAPSKPTSQAQSPVKHHRTIGGRIPKSAPNNVSSPSSRRNDQSSSPPPPPSATKATPIPKGHDRYGPCPYRHCGGYKIRRRNNPNGAGRDAGKWAFVCSKRTNTPRCNFYECLECDPYPDIQQRFRQFEHGPSQEQRGRQERERHRQLREEQEQDRELHEQLQGEQDLRDDRRAVSPVLSNNRMAVCPKCQRGHLIEKATDTLAYTEKYVECSRRRMQDGTQCDYQKLIMNPDFFPNDNNNSNGDGDAATAVDPDPDPRWDAFSYIAAVPAPVTKKEKPVIDLTAESDEEDSLPLITGIKKVIHQGQRSQVAAHQSKRAPATLTTNSRPSQPSSSSTQGGRRGNSNNRSTAAASKGANRERQVVNLDPDDDDDDDYEEVEGPRSNASGTSANKNKRKKKTASKTKEDEFEDVDSDFDNELILIVDQMSRPSSGGRRL